MSGGGSGVPGKEARDAENDRVVNLLLHVVEDNRKERDDSRRLREQLGDAVTGIEAATALLAVANERTETIESRIAAMESRHERVERNVATSAQKVTDMEGHLASFLPQFHVILTAAGQKADKTAAVAFEAALSTQKALEATRAEVKEAREKTEKVLLKAEDAAPKGPWTHFIDRFDRVSTRTWLLTMTLLILAIIAAFGVYLADLGLKRRQEAPHARDAVVVVPSGPNGESKPHRDAR